MLTQAIYIVLLVSAIALLLPAVVLFIECLAAALPAKMQLTESPLARPRFAVLVPAHNESSGIAGTLRSIHEQLLPTDQLIVVADNCTDDTASIARRICTEVIERDDALNRGKGHALRAGLDFLAIDPPEVVIFIDADCLLAPNCLSQLTNWIVATERPIQGNYQMLPPQNAAAGSFISAFAVVVKNTVRPLGLSRLGLPCLITGSGMGMPWKLAKRLKIDHGNIVEDMQLSVDLSISGSPPTYCENAKIISSLPSNGSAVKTQRTRWEHGHLQTLLTQSPRLLWSSILNRRMDLLGLALDLAVPPLSLLTLCTIFLFCTSVIFGAATSLWLPASLMFIAGTVISTAITIAWLLEGYRVLPFSSLISIPKYVIQKIPLYVNYLYKRQLSWIRTERTKNPQSDIPAARDAILQNDEYRQSKVSR